MRPHGLIPDRNRFYLFRNVCYSHQNDKGFYGFACLCHSGRPDIRRDNHRICRDTCHLDAFCLPSNHLYRGCDNDHADHPCFVSYHRILRSPMRLHDSFFCFCMLSFSHNLHLHSFASKNEFLDGHHQTTSS
jgi:hypothetical protein